MAKLYFRYGTVGSAKTLNLLAVAHNYLQQSKRAFIIKPELDDRFGRDLVHSRAGMEKKADLLVGPESVLDLEAFAGVDCVLVDEAQFLSPRLVDQLRTVAQQKNVPVICYGLRTDFRTTLFEGARRLMEVADAIEEVKTTCNYCNRKAVFNLKLADGVPTVAGPTVDLGSEEKYLPACAACYTAKLREAGCTPPVGAR
jgi:thymidine kinase